MSTVALRIDVDTFRGTREGVPRLLKTLDAFHIRALFLFSVGPDNMGRHLWRLIRPAFLWKMLRSNAPGLYGWDILLRGTFWPGPMIAPKNAEIIRLCANAGHEIGVHAWDHHFWQTHIQKMTPEEIRHDLKRACDALTEIIGRLPDCSASPGWRCTPQVIFENDGFGFRYNSDCLGNSIFMPEVNGTRLNTPQIPRTLPTYDEVVGRNGITPANYNQYLLNKIQENPLNVLTIHAEVEGGMYLELFEDFLRQAKKLGITFCAPGELLTTTTTPLPTNAIELRNCPGREGWMAVQESAQLNWC